MATAELCNGKGIPKFDAAGQASVEAHASTPFLHSLLLTSPCSISHAQIALCLQLPTTDRAQTGLREEKFGKSQLQAVPLWHKCPESSTYHRASSKPAM